MRKIEEENRFLKAEETQLREEMKLKKEGDQTETLGYTKNIILKYMENPEQQHKVCTRADAVACEM